MSPLTELPLMELPLSHRFGVFFFVGGVVPNPIDIRFQRVSGLSAQLELNTLNEGGQNLYSHRLPTRVTQNTLLLERGLVLGSPLVQEFKAALGFFQFAPSNVMVTLFGSDATPVAAWMFSKAFPTRLSTADLNAGQDNQVLIDTMELAYAHMKPVEL